MDGKGDLSARWAWIAVVCLWLACCAFMIWGAWANIRFATFSDPDDALRFVEVRDWMGGQSWFDVTQYRSQPPFGAPMHWSRLVDVPIAALITLFGWFMPPVLAQRAAVMVEPLILFLILCIIVHRLTVAITDRRLAGVFAVALGAMSVGIVVQYYPNRIDHHGWQILLGALGCLFLIHAIKGHRSAAAGAGLSMAAAMAVAIECLPLAVGVGAAFAFLYWRDGGRSREPGQMLLGYLAAMSVGAAILPLVTLGWPAAAVPWCDALSPAYLWPMLLATAVLAILIRRAPQSHWLSRLVTLAVAGGGATLMFRLSTPLCAAGPFATLDPLVYNIWYSNISEGLPLWKQGRDIWIMLPTPSLLGLVAVGWAIRQSDGKRRDLWIAMLVVQIVTFLVSLMVMRAMGLAHLAALPGCGWLFFTLIQRSRRLASPAARVLAGALCVLATPIGLEALIVSVMPMVTGAEKEKPTPAGDSAPCLNPATLRGLSALPRTILFAPLDIGSHLLAFTPHSVVATGHHRARQGMKAVISAFIANPEQARSIVAGMPATHLVYCADGNEVQKYAREYPASLMAALLKGRPPLWLRPVRMQPDESIHVYRIERPEQAF